LADRGETIKVEDNMLLNEPFIEEEVSHVVDCMVKIKAPGPMEFMLNSISPAEILSK
jgi:hypothetical protein